MGTNENLPPNVLKHLAKELKNLNETPPEGIKVSVNDDNFAIINAEIEGPVGTPYENGLFCMKLILSHEFPQSPPKGYFLTKIFHPNIATNGEICVNALKKDWNPGVGLRHVLMVIRCLLIEPFPESALNEQAGKMLLEDYDEYARYARLYTEIHAKPKAKFKVGAITESTKVLNVDQTNPVICTVDQKNAEPGTQVQSPPPFGPSNAMKGGNSQLKPILTSKGTETGAGAGASVSVPSLSLLKQKEASLTKVHAGKKKIDARTKSLKRL